MTKAVTGKAKYSADLTLTNTLENGVRATTPISVVGSVSYTGGVQANQANEAWQSGIISLASGADTEINLRTFAGWDLGAGAGKDGLGQTPVFQEVVEFWIEHVSGDGLLEVKPSTSSGWTPVGEHLESDGAAISVGGCIHKCSPGEVGFDVIPGTSEAITLEAVDGALTCRVTIIGRNDDDASSSSSSSSSASSSSSSVSSASSSSQSSSESSS